MDVSKAPWLKGLFLAGILLLFAGSGQTLASGGNPIQSDWDKPHYFVGDKNGQSNCYHVEYAATAPDYPKAIVSISYAGESIRSNWEIDSGVCFGGATTQSHRTRSQISVTVELYDPWRRHVGTTTWSKNLSWGDNKFEYKPDGKTRFRINFHYPQYKPGSGIANVYVRGGWW